MRIKIPVIFCLALLSGATVTAQQPGTPAQKVKTSGLTPEQVSALLEKRASKSRPFVPGEIIVKLKSNGLLGAAAAPAIQGLQLEVKRANAATGETVYRLPTQLMGTMSTVEQGNRTLATVAALRQRPDVEYAQPNYLVQIAATPNDALYPAQWHYRQIDLPEYWDDNTGAASVVVAVIDTGILKTHEDIAGSANLLPGFDMISVTSIANDGDGRDGDSTDTGDAVTAGECGPGSLPQPSSWHGTHVSGTIGATRTNNSLGIAGVNWNVKVLPIRVLGKCGGTIEDINDAIRWAAGLPVQGVPANTNKAKVINMSLGGPSRCLDSPATQAAIDAAVAAGVTVVVAAGNEAQDAAGFLPASCTNVITVAAGDQRGRLVTRYSNFGPRIDLMAPGGDVQRDDDGDGNPDGVLSTVQGGYNYYNGTSMAAPHVAGAAALLIARDSALTPAQVLAELKASALPRSTTECPNGCGAGLLHMRVNQTTPTPPPTPSPPASPKVSLVVAPETIKVGGTGVAVATVTSNGNPDPNKAVIFSSSNGAIASVSPLSATTDSAGKASVTVSGIAKGTTTVEAKSQGKSETKPVTVKAAALPLSVAALLAGILLVGYASSEVKARRTRAN